MRIMQSIPLRFMIVWIFDYWQKLEKSLWVWLLA